MAGPDARPLQAVPVVRTDSGKRVGPDVVGDQDVSHLGMGEPVQQASAHDRPAADAGPDGQVYETLVTGGRAPRVLTQGCGVNVGVERYREPELSSERAGRDRYQPSPAWVWR